MNKISSIFKNILMFLILTQLANASSGENISPSDTLSLLKEKDNSFLSAQYVANNGDEKMDSGTDYNPLKARRHFSRFIEAMTYGNNIDQIHFKFKFGTTEGNKIVHVLCKIKEKKECSQCKASNGDDMFEENEIRCVKLLEEVVLNETK